MDKFTPDLSMQHLLMKTRIKIEQTSGYGQSIFAHWLKYACEHSDKGLDHFTKTSQNPK